MKKYILASFIVLTFIVSVQAQTASEVFTKMPISLMLSLSNSSRLDLLDMQKAGKAAIIKNEFGDSCSIEQLADDYLQLKSGTSSTEIILLPMINDSKVVCLIQTECAPICDSRIEFYSTSWKQLDAKAFINPVNKEWFIKENVNLDDTTIYDNYIALSIPLMQFHYDKEKKVLTQTYTTLSYLNVEDREKMDAYLKSEPKTYQWTLTRFE